MPEQPAQSAPQNPRIFPSLEGIGYVLKLATLHQKLKPSWYLEIGSLAGESLKVATANSIAIDPQFVLKPAVYVGKKELHLFQTTSDAFFESGRLAAITDKLDFAFLDGMHLFDFLLRDFINTEKIAQKLLLLRCTIAFRSLKLRLKEIGTDPKLRLGQVMYGSLCQFLKNTAQSLAFRFLTARQAA